MLEEFLKIVQGSEKLRALWKKGSQPFYCHVTGKKIIKYSLHVHEVNKFRFFS